jgi:hypothetical protein
MLTSRPTRKRRQRSALAPFPPLRAALGRPSSSKLLPVQQVRSSPLHSTISCPCFSVRAIQVLGEKNSQGSRPGCSQNFPLIIKLGFRACSNLTLWAASGKFSPERRCCFGHLALLSSLMAPSSEKNLLAFASKAKSEQALSWTLVATIRQDAWLFPARCYASPTPVWPLPNPQLSGSQGDD